jgi:hypothetical protein
MGGDDGLIDVNARVRLLIDRRQDFSDLAGAAEPLVGRLHFRPKSSTQPPFLIN